MSGYNTRGPIHWDVETNGHHHEFCRRQEMSAWKVRLTSEHKAVTCNYCLKRLAKLDDGKDVEIRPKVNREQVNVRKAARVREEMRALGVVDV